MFRAIQTTQDIVMRILSKPRPIIPCYSYELTEDRMLATESVAVYTDDGIY